MPRHRKQRVPWHRALRHADNPARRARLMPAVSASIAALFHSAGDDPDAVDTVELRPPARHFRAHARASTHPAIIGTGALRTAARGLVVTPWFAAASGFVIAASLWIYAPHAHLQFPSGGNAIQSTHCNQSCVSASGRKYTGQLAGKGSRADPGRSGKGAGAPQGVGGSNGSAASGLTFSYYPMHSPPGTFTIMIWVVGQHAIKAWQLHFVLSGDRIRQVWGAHWHRTSPDSGTVSGGGQLGQWNRSGHDDGGQFGAGTHQNGFTFVVSGSGQPTRPTNCVYNGQSCTFVNGRPGPA